MSEIEILLFWVIVLGTFILYAGMVFLKLKIKRKITLTLSMPLLFSMVSTLSLWSNYQSSLLPKDGIGINNKLSYAIIGEDGWSVNLFEECYQRSLEITVIGFCIFLIAVIFESFLKNGGLRGEDA